MFKTKYFSIGYEAKATGNVQMVVSILQFTLEIFENKMSIQFSSKYHLPHFRHANSLKTFWMLKTK